MSDWLVLINPYAGKGRSAERRTREVLTGLGVDADIVLCDGTDELHRVVTDAIAAGRTRFVAVGGDGTVNAVVTSVSYDLVEGMQTVQTDFPTLNFTQFLA